MKKKFPVVFLLLLFATALIWMIVMKNGNESIPTTHELLPRKQALAYTAEWETVKNNATVLQKKISGDSKDTKSMIALAALYIQEGRITENFGHYNASAMKLVEDVLVLDANNFEALTFKSTILLSQHQFEEAGRIAEQARQLFPQNAYVYGLLVDARVEQGNYKLALEAADKMIAIRPDIRSYARVAYLRELFGDIPGAINAMTMAVDAGMPGDEHTEWCRYQLGKLYEKSGNIDEAELNYKITLTNRENYPYGLIGLAGIAVAQKNFEKALSLYQQADTLCHNHIVKEGIIEVYQLTGKHKKAREMAKEVLAQVRKMATTGNEDLEMAHAYIGLENYDKALEYAMKEYARRPANIEVNETIAIIHYKKSDYYNALDYIKAALVTNCKNPELLAYAGLIFLKTGKNVEGKNMLQEALKNKPLIAADLKEEIQATGYRL